MTPLRQYIEWLEKADIEYKTYFRGNIRTEYSCVCVSVGKAVLVFKHDTSELVDVETWE